MPCFPTGSLNDVSCVRFESGEMSAMLCGSTPPVNAFLTNCTLILVQVVLIALGCTD